VEVTLRGVSSVMGAIGTDFVKSTFNLIKVAATRDDGEHHNGDALFSFFFCTIYKLIMYDNTKLTYH